VRLARIAAALLPGLFLLGFNIGTGSVTAMAKAGSAHGMSLLWALALSCFVTWRLIALYGRFTIVTGLTALAAFRRHIHPAFAVFFIVALGTNVCGSVMGVMGVIASITAHTIERLTGVTVAPVAVAAFYCASVYAAFLRGRTKFFEQCLAVLVAIMGLCFALNAMLVAPGWRETLGGLVPGLPRGNDTTPFLTIASMVGTTVFSGLFIVRTTLVRDAGWTLADHRKQEWDAAVSALLMFLLSAAIMAAGAGVLHVRGTAVESPMDMLSMLEPLAGTAAAAVFAVGIVAAGLSSQFPNVILLPWLLADYSGAPADLRRSRVRWIVLGISLLGLVVPLAAARPISVMLASQAFGALLLPATVGALLYLGRRRDVMGEHRFGTGDVVFLVAALGLALFIAALGLRGFLDLLRATLAHA
jgi:Mn2+/Fe2+ NRAMP family transporter